MADPKDTKEAATEAAPQASAEPIPPEVPPELPAEASGIVLIAPKHTSSVSYGDEVLPVKNGRVNVGERPELVRFLLANGFELAPAKAARSGK